MVTSLSDLKAWLSGQEALTGRDDWMVAIAAALLLTGAAVLALIVAGAVFRWLARRVESWRSTWLKGIRFQGQQLLSGDDALGIARALVRWLRIGFFALAAYLYLNGVFGLFPATAALADRMLDSLFDALRLIGTEIVEYLPSLAVLIALFFVARWTIRALSLFFLGVGSRRITLPGFDPEWAGPTYKIVRTLLIFFFLVVAFPYVPGSSSPAFQGISIFVGVLVSLGSSGAVANVISGVVLTYTRAFRIGDRVRIADVTGDVIEKTLFVTRIRTPKNEYVTIPNAMVLGHHVVNWSSQAEERGIVLHTTVTIGYDVPWERVKEQLLEAAQATEHIETEPEPFVLQTSLDDFYVHHELNAYTREAKLMPQLYSNLHRNILDKFHAAGIEIASPHLSSVRDGNQVQIPEAHLPSNYSPTGFRLLPLPGIGTIRREGGGDAS